MEANKINWPALQNELKLAVQAHALFKRGPLAGNKPLLRRYDERVSKAKRALREAEACYQAHAAFLAAKARRA